MEGMGTVGARERSQMNPWSDAIFAGTNGSAKSGVRQALEVCKDVINPSRQHVKDIVDSICDFFGCDEHTRTGADPTRCPTCRYVLVDAITLTCGHSICTRCLIISRKNDPVCHKCDEKVPHDFVENSKVNVVVNNICHLWWGKQIEAARRRNDVLDVYDKSSVPSRWDDDVHKLITKLSIEDHSISGEDVDFDPSRASHISKLKRLFGEIGDAKKQAALCINKVPDWFMGHVRLAEAYEAELDVEDAIIYYSHAYILSPNSKIRIEIKERLINIMNSYLSVKNHDVQFSKSHELSSTHSDDEEMDFISTNSQIKPDLAASMAKPIDNLVSIIDKLLVTVDKVPGSQNISCRQVVDQSKVDITDFECPLCCRMFWHPVTTPCGHTFCLACLDRCLDHNTKCPLCKQSIASILNSSKPVTEFLDYLTQTYFPYVYAKRKSAFEDEMHSFKSGIEDGSVLPIFICTVAFPGIPCPLHIYEPRYKLMLRRTMNSKCRKFGMCVSSFEVIPASFAKFGTVLNINQVNYLLDGRAVVDSTGLKRFRVSESFMKDGYSVASVVWLEDEIPQGHIEQEELLILHNNIRTEVKNWVNNLDDMVRRKIIQFLGNLPNVEDNYHLLPNGPKWLWWTISVLPINQKIQVSLLGITTLKKRLLIVHRIMQMIKDNPPMP